jgi:hypothetical protein
MLALDRPDERTHDDDHGHGTETLENRRVVSIEGSPVEKEWRR